MTLPSSIHREYHDLKRGILLILIAWLFFSTSYLMAKLVADTASIYSLLWIRYAIGVICVMPWMIYHRKVSFKSSNLGLISIRTISYFINTWFTFIAAQLIPLVDATLLFSSAPIFVPFIIWLWLKRPIASKLWPCIILGFIGVILILNPTKQIFNPGALLALAAGITSAVSLVVTRMVAHKEQVHTLLFYVFLLSLIAITPLAIWGWKILTWKAFWFIIVIGISSTVGQWLLFKSLQYGKSSYIAPFGYVSVIYSGIFDWLIFGKIPGVLTFVGIVLVMAAGIILILSSKPPKVTEKF